MRILVLHGDGSFAKDVGAMLGARNCSVVSAQSIADARKHIERKMPDAVLAYAAQRPKTCYRSCRSLKKHYPDLAIAVITENNEGAIAAENDCPGMGYYLWRSRISPGFFRRIERETRARRELREERDFNAAVLDSAAALIMVLSPKGVIERANRAFLDVLGYNPKKLIGSTPKSFLADKASINASQGVIKNPPKPGEIRRCETVWLAKNGRNVHMSWSSVAVYEPSGKVRHFICTGTDVSDWVEAQERQHQSEQRFSRVFHASPAVFAFTRMSDGYHYDVNERWLSVLGFKPSEVIGKTAKQLNIWADPGDRKRIAALLKKTRKVRDFEARFRTKKGELRDFMISAERVQVDGEDRILFLANDVTEFKRTTLELAHRHAAEKLIADITKAFLQKKLDGAIRFALASIGKFLDVDYVGVYRFDIDPDLMVNTHGWTMTEKSRAPKEDLRKDVFVYCARCFEEGKSSIVRRLSDLPKWGEKERAALQKKGILSMINVPLMMRGEAVGCLSVDLLKQEREWDKDDINLVTAAAEAIALGVLARESEAELEATLKDMAQTVEERTRDLRASEERLRDMTDAASDWRWEMDSALAFSRFSDSVRRILGFDAKDLIGKRRQDMAWVDMETGGTASKQAMKAHMQDLRDHKPFRDFNYTMRRRDGTLRHVRISGKPVFGPKGEFTGYRGTGTDITAEVEAARKAARAQTQLVESMESIDGGMALFDRDLKFVLCNTRYREEYADLVELLEPGTDYEQIVRASIERGIVDIGDEPLEEWVASRLCQPESLKQASEQKMKDGRWGLVNDYVTREGGRLIVRADITAQKQVEEALRASEERRRVVLETVIDGIVTIDKEGTVLSLNPAAEGMFGYDADEVLGRNVSMLMPEPYHTAHDGYLNRYMETGVPHIIGIGREVEGLRRDGTVFPLDLAVSQTEMGGEIIFVGVIRDISERKQGEQDLRRARFEAEASNKAKSQFLANMSHELRTPLNAILGFSETMSSEIFGPVANPRYQEYIRNIQDSGHHLLTLINDILDLSKIEAGAFELSEEPVKVSELVRGCLSFVSTQAHDRRIHIETTIADGLSDYLLDIRRMKQVILNLMSNALKFGHPDGTVKLSAFADDDGALVLTVEDDGIGMTAPEISLALSEFGQVQSTREHSRAHEGTGLGLPLSNNLIKVHGGTLNIESEKEKGTRVIVRLPASRRLP